MTKPEDVADQRAPWIELKLGISADLSASAIEEAYKVLRAAGDEGPYVLTTGHDELLSMPFGGRELIAWMWDNHRGLSYFTVPSAMLRNPHTWAIHGRSHAVVVDGP